MKVLVLNSGLGTRMGAISAIQPKCMSLIYDEETILSRQLKLIKEAGLKEVVITTGKFDELIKEYCATLQLDLDISYIKNEEYEHTNYIYSIYCAREVLKDDVLLLHGDLVFSKDVLRNIIISEDSSMIISSTEKLPEKDFKAVVENGRIIQIGVQFFKNSFAAQPLYKIKKKDWEVWLNEIIHFCENNKVDVYAENAFNEISRNIILKPLDIASGLCKEVDTIEDLERIQAELEGQNRCRKK